MAQVTERKVHIHARVLGWQHIVGYAVVLLSGFLALSLLLGIAAMTGDRAARAIMGSAGMIFGALLVVFAVPGIVSGFGLLQFRSWGRVQALMVAALELFSFPLGTALGIRGLR